MRKSLIHVLTLVAVSVLPAIAGQMSVGDLLKLCTSPDEGDKNACTFYILGVTEGASGLSLALVRNSNFPPQDMRLLIPNEARYAG